MTWSQYSQHRRIRDLEERLSDSQSQLSRERTHLRSKLGQIQGTLEERLDRVSATLDAFMELTDIRADLAMFDDAALARHRTLQLLDGAALPDLTLKDVPGYWLVPAAHGLHALLNDDVSKARVRFDEAAELDHERARCFTALAAPLTRPEHARTLGASVAADMLPHLPGPGTRLNRVQRALWLLTADGSYGEDAREHLLRSTSRAWSAEDVRIPAANQWIRLSPVEGRRRGTRESSSLRRAQAAQALGDLRERVARLTALGSEDTPFEVLAHDQASTGFLTETLRLLVEEGTAEEAPLLVQADRLRSVIEDNRAGQAIQAWSDPVETVGTLLQRDLSREDAPAHRRTFALALQRTALLDTADTLVERACEPVLEETVLNSYGARITVTGSGADARQVDRARQQLRDLHTPNSRYRTVLFASLVTTVVLVLLALLTLNNALWFLAAVAGAVGAGAYFSGERDQAKKEEALGLLLQKLDQQVERTVGDLRRTRAEAEEHAATARTEVEKVRPLLDP
ncbi:hypothetical protein [Nocardiopsis nanhaiensis]